MRSKRTRVGIRRFLPALVALVLVANLGTALATAGNLPGGTPISVTITNPSDGDLIGYPPGNITLEGTASVGEGVPVPNTLIVYVVDVSYSTISGAGGTGCGGDQNSDGQSDTILDCEIAATKALNNLAVSFGTVGDVGVAVYGGKIVNDPNDTGGAAADVGPVGGVQLLTGPATDAGGAAGPDVEEVLESAFSQASAGYPAGVSVFTVRDVGSNGTNFAAGLEAAMDIVAASSKPNKVVVFMSDGLANTGQPVSSVTVPAGVLIYTFAVGTVSSCSSDPNSLGSLDDIASKGAPGSECTNVATVGDLPEVVPGVIAAELTSLELSVDGGPAVDISGYASETLPAEDPVSVSYSYPMGLTPGIHQLCVTAKGSDGGGAGQVTECINVTVATIDLSPETALNELGTPPQDHTVTAVVAAGADDGVSDVPVEFEVISGPNAGPPGSALTNGEGQAGFTYTALQGCAGLVGTDVIRACFTDDLGIDVCDSAEKAWVDTTEPEVECLACENPHGKKVPPAGDKSPGQNEDGFYELMASDAVDPDPQIYVLDTGSGTVFGPFSSGTKIKYTEDSTATPEQKKIGSSKGKAGEIDWHIIGNGDAAIYAVDCAGNVSDEVICPVPPPPK